MSEIKKYITAGCIIISISLILILLYVLLFKGKLSNGGAISQIYRDINTDKIYNPDDILPSTPGKYSSYLKSSYLEDGISYIINKNGFLLNSISNLPPNKIATIVFGDIKDGPFVLQIQTNNEGILYFNDKLEGLPIGLMNYISHIYIQYITYQKNTILNYEGIPKYSNVVPYNTPIATYTVLSDSDIKNNYKLPYNMSIISTGVCPDCFDSNKKLISNVTFKKTFNAIIDSTKTLFYPVSGDIDEQTFCSKICS